MPSRNRVKVYLPNTYYHVYNRGVEERKIFLDNGDYAVFLNLLKRYLDDKTAKDPSGRVYDNLAKEVELTAYCLMPTHFHLLLYQVKPQGMTKLMRRVLGAYSTYFNKKHQRIGTLFQERFKATDIDNEAYLWHITRYIHLNPAKPRQYPFSSYDNYINNNKAAWLKPKRILDMHKEYSEPYEAFVNDYKDYKQSLIEIKHQLAD